MTMTEKDRMLKTLFSAESGAELVDIKFFLGDDRNITQEDLCQQVNNVLTQQSLGSTKLVKSIDSHLRKVEINQFLSS